MNHCPHDDESHEYCILFTGLFCLFYFLGIKDKKIFTSGVTEDHVDRTRFLK